MAELGVIASIIGVAAVGAKLSKTLFMVGSRTANAGSNIHRIGSNVSLFCSTLKHVAQVLDDSRSLHTPEAVDTAMTIVNECGYLFEEIGKITLQANEKNEFGPTEGITANDKRRRPSMVKRVKWYFEQPKVDYMLAQLEQLKTTLSMLIQTLSLAELMAATRREEAASERLSQQVTDQRTHVETLLIAQQLSFVVLNQFNHQEEQHNWTEGSREESPSTIETEDFVQVPYRTPQKLLTQQSTSSSLVKFGSDGLEFLTQPVLDEEGTMSPIMRRSRDCVDQLLNRWTRIQEIEIPADQTVPRQNSNDKGPVHPDVVDLEEQALAGPSSRRSTHDEIEIEEIEDEVTDVNVPDLKLEKVESLPKPQRTMSSPPPSNNMLSSQLPPPRNENSASPTSSAFPELPPPPKYSGSPRPNSRLALARSGSTPGPDQMSSIMSPQYTPSLDIRGLPPGGPPGIGPGAAQNTWTPNQSNAFGGPSAVRSTSPASLTASPTTTAKIEYYTQPQTTNYRKPFVSTRNSSDESGSDSEDDRRKPPSLGLGIPWRIRIGTKYWDFLDARLVGPRTPYLPQESMSWVYSHDSAITEISARWVAEEALAEGRYPYSEVRPSEHPNMAGGDRRSNNYTWTGAGRVEEDVKWRVLRPLKFNEIESLVERTIDLYRSRTRPGSSDSTTAPRSRAARPSAKPQQPYLRVAPPSQNQPQYPPQQNPPPQFPQPQRSVSFSDTKLPPRNSRDRSPRNPNDQYYAGDLPHRPAPPSSGHWSAGATPGLSSSWNTPGGNMPPLQTRQGQAGRGWRGDGPQTPGGGGGEWGRDGGRQRGGYDFDRDFDRDYDDHRPTSRGKVSNSGEKEKERKKRRSATAGTLARLGGIIALLDGLEYVV